MWNFFGRGDRVDSARLDILERRLAALEEFQSTTADSLTRSMDDQARRNADQAKTNEDARRDIAHGSRMLAEAEEIDKARDIQIEHIEGALRNHADEIEKLRALVLDERAANTDGCGHAIAKAQAMEPGLTELRAQMKGLSGEYESFKKTVLAGLGLSGGGGPCDDGFGYKSRLDRIEERSRWAEGQAKKAAGVIRDLGSVLARVAKFMDAPKDDEPPAAGKACVVTPLGPPPTRGAAVMVGLKEPSLGDAFRSFALARREDDNGASSFSEDN